MNSTAADTSPANAGAVHTELVVGSPLGCPVAQASADTGRLACRVSRSTGPDSERVVGEFELVDDEQGFAGGNHDASQGFDLVDCQRVFQTDAGEVYRFDEERHAPCPCQVVERLDIPLSSVTARDGQLHLTFHAADVETVRNVVAELRSAFDEVTLRQLTRDREDRGSEQLAADGRSHHVLVDRGTLTDRQLEVLETAHALGYFDHPRDATGCEVAEALDIAPSTFSEHLADAQSKLMTDVLDDDQC
jgi:predicted DNA binding protein